jgi:hypothetical protein
MSEDENLWAALIRRHYSKFVPGYGSNEDDLPKEVFARCWTIEHPKPLVQGKSSILGNLFTRMKIGRFAWGSAQETRVSFFTMMDCLFTRYLWLV